MEPLPVDAKLPELLVALRTHGCAVLRAPTGAGKTTRVPPALLDSGVAGDGKVVVLEPRRVAARAAARRIADERGGRVGGEVGYSVRFDRRSGADTRIEVVTEGLFVRRLQADPFLDGVGAVVLDEFHERSLDADLALAMAHRVREDARPDLALVVMSATLAAERVAAYLGDCPSVTCEGRLHPVEVRYLPHADKRPVHEATAAGVRDALDATDGDVLAFLPGVGEIRRTGRELEATAARRGLLVTELYGDLPADRQDAALSRADRRKVVLATNVAQTSVTIEGITAVVDSGLARVPRIDPAVGLPRLEITRISHAAADQRAGRAGRTAPGVCLRLWPERENPSLPEHDEPEIRRADLAATVLELRCWGESDLAAFPWFDAPDAAALERATRLLERLGALDGGTVTDVGRAMVRLPVHPRLARMLVQAHATGVTRDGALLAALLAERDPFRRRGRTEHHSESDVLDRLALLREGGRGGGLAFVRRAGEQLLRQARDALGNAPGPDGDTEEALLRAVFAGFPDRVARRREAGSPRARMVGGRGVRLAEESAVREPQLFVCVDVDAGRRGEGAESLVRQASAARRAWLDPARVTSTVDVVFDAERERVAAWHRTRYDDLVVEEAPAAPPDDQTTWDALARAAADRTDRALGLDDGAVASLRARAACLREWMPELGLPSLGDDAIRAVLPDLCRGRRSFAELRKAPLLAHLKGRLTYDQLSALDREAPERLEVPSGSRIALAYEPGKPPVLAVRIQEVFGLTETPRVAAGRVPVLLHLLAPNRRPQQVTDDLASFWANTYTVVRKELRRRYPKHAWPEDPLTAEPEKRSRRRKG